MAMRIRRKDNPFKGVRSHKIKLADGNYKTYWYAWKNGPRLPDEYGSPVFIEAFLEATKTKKKSADAETLQYLLDKYQDSSDFTLLAPRTRTDYKKIIEQIEAEFSTFPLVATADKRTRGIFLEWRDKLAKNSLRHADYAWAVLARTMSWGVNRGMIQHNPCAKAGRLYEADRTEAVWTINDETAYLKVAGQHLGLPLLLALWTGQREGDLLRLSWSQYDGTHIRLVQSKSKRRGKGGKRVIIPVGKPLKLVLDALFLKRNPNPLDRILLNSFGEPWTESGFRASFRKTCALAGIQGLTFHDIRGTSVTRLAIAGASVPQIATFTGHSLKDVEAILDTHYLNRDARLAEDALQKLETGTY